jgi:ubiquinone/menaquinone biosynthesis C-methylase UbiE
MVSVVIPFFNAERFIEEAIEGVFAQTYDRWELLLVDDGSGDGSTRIAREYAARWPRKVRYLEHEGHQNRGDGATRNLGLDHARGEFVAMLDSDDVWDPGQLEEQVRLLADCPGAGMVYGSTFYWYSWAGETAERKDAVVPDLATADDSVVAPPRLVARFQPASAFCPVPSFVLFRRAALVATGGGVEGFGMGSDRTLIFKVCLRFPVLVVSRCWGKYRRHPDALTGRATPAQFDAEQFQLLEWLADHLRKEEIRDKGLWRVIREELRPYHHPLLHRALAYAHPVADRLKRLPWYLSRRIRGLRSGRIVARPNPVSVFDPLWLGATTVSWSATGVEKVEVRVDHPNGPLLSRTVSSGSAQTGSWVADGMTFYLQDASAGDGPIAGRTLATVKVTLLLPRRPDHTLYRPYRLSPERYDAELKSAGMDRFLTGSYRLRNQALAEWILETRPSRVFEFAAGGAGLALLLENAVQEYVWSDFASVAVEAAQKLLKRADVRRIDIREAREAIPWGRYDTVVCVSPGDLPNDLEILSEVSPGANVFVSCATLEESSQARVFPTERSVRDRFEGVLEITRLKTVGDQILLQGVRKDRVYPARELRRMFVTKHHYYLKKHRGMNRFIARNLYGRVLEIGCRDGFLVPYLDCRKYVGVDPCQEAIEEAKRRHAADFIVSDWRDLACSGAFDSIYLNDALRCQADKEGAVRRYERFKPSRIVVQELDEVRIGLPYKLRSQKSFRLEGGQPERFRRRVVYVYDL